MLQERVATPNLRGSDEFAPLHEDLSPNGQRETGRGPPPVRRRCLGIAMPRRFECGCLGTQSAAIRRSLSERRPHTSPRVRARPPFLRLAYGLLERSDQRSPPSPDCDQSRVWEGSSNTIGAKRYRAELRRLTTARRLPCSRCPNVPEQRQSVSTGRPAVRPSDRQTVAYASTGGHVHTRFRSPNAASIRPMGGHTLCSRVAAVGKPARSRA